MQARERGERVDWGEVAELTALDIAIAGDDLVREALEQNEKLDRAAVRTAARAAGIDPAELDNI